MSEATPTDALNDQEAATARWKALLHDPEFMDALLSGMPKRPPGWCQQAPGEDAIAYMFRIFPVVRPH